MNDVLNPALTIDSQSPSSAADGVTAAATVTIGARPALLVAKAPTAIGCLQCQLIGKRRLTCSKADACADLPMSFAVGPVLLAAWAVTAIAFVLAVL